MLIAKTAPNRNDLVALTPPTWATLCDFAQTLDLHTILAGQQQLRKSEDQIKNTTQPRLWLEVTLMGLLPSAIGSQQSGVSEKAGFDVSAQPNGGRRQKAEGSPVRATDGVAIPPVQPVKVPQAEAIAPSPVEAAEPAEAIAASLPIAHPESVVNLANTTNALTSGASDDLSQIWQEILSHIDLKGTRAMLSVNCYLLSQNEQETLVGVKTQKMLKMITGMIPQLEKAAAKVLKTKVKVALQVAEAAPPAAPTVQHPETSDRPFSSDGDAGDRPTNQSPDTLPAASVDPSIVPASSNNGQSGMPSHAPLTPQPSSPNHALESAAAYTPDQWQQEDEVTRAAKQLADFFGGRVVDMSDSDTVAEAPKLAEIDAASLKEEAAMTLPETDYEPDEDDDVPF